MQVLIRRWRNLIDIGTLTPVSIGPLPAWLIEFLAPALTYTYLESQIGTPEAYDRHTGHYQPITAEQRRLYRLEPLVAAGSEMVEPAEGRLVTGPGFLTTLMQRLQRAGCQVQYQDLRPPRLRAGCYQTDWDNVRRHFTFRARQEDCLAAMAASDGGILAAATGFGKTRMFEAVCWLYPQAKIAIVVKSRDIAAKIAGRLTQHFPNVGLITGQTKRSGDRITVYTAGCLAHCDGDYDLLLCDEVHQLMSPYYSELLGRVFQDTRNFGFTATPTGRFDGASAKLEMFFGPQLFQIDYADAVANKLVVPIHVRWIPIPLSQDPGCDKRGVALDRWGLWRNQQRNWLFAKDIREHCTDDDQILCSVATVDHAIHLWQFLPDFTLCYSNTEADNFNAWVRAKLIPPTFEGITAARRDQMRVAFEDGRLRRVIATDVWSTGVDFDQLAVLYRCDGRASEILNAQWPGRVSRLHADKSCGVVVDGYDMFNSTLKRRSMTRKALYAKQGWTQDWPSGRRLLDAV